MRLEKFKSVVAPKDLYYKDIEYRKDLQELKEVLAIKPPVFGYCSDSGFYQYVGTNMFQWWTKTGTGWTSYGEVVEVVLSEEGE